MQIYNFFLLYCIFLLLLHPILILSLCTQRMKIGSIATKLLLTATLVMTTSTAAGQVSVTKSGTAVTPMDHPRATLPLRQLNQKSASTLSAPTAGTYLVVTREDLLPTLAPLLDWKRQQGYDVETLVMTTRESDSIRAALQARYDNASALRPAQKYVLLVGDVDRLQSCQGRYAPGGLENGVTDLYYGEYTGDYVPEALVGRLSVRDSAELSAVVRKTIDYEQGRWAAAEKMLLTAGAEQRANAATTTNGQVHYLSHLVATYRPELDTVCFYNPASGDQLDSIVRALDRPNALINYTAHCTMQGWSNPSVKYPTIDTLDGAVPTVWVNNCCLSNAFGTTCFGERLLRNATGGAVAVIGATNETLWDEDYYWVVGAKYPPTENPIFDSERPGAFDHILTGRDVSESGDITASGWVTTGQGKNNTGEMPRQYDADAVAIGSLIFAGCSAVTLVGSPYDAFYWETYCLLGDPSLSLMLGAVDTLALDVVMGTLPESVDSLSAGATSVTVLGSPWCRVSATQNGALLGTTLTDSAGWGTIHLYQGLSGDSLTLTATRPESIYKQITLPIKAPHQGCIAVTEATLDAEETSLELRLRNVGQTRVLGHHLTLTQTAEDRTCGAALLADSLSATIDSLPSGMEMLLTWPLGEYSIGQMPLFLGRVTLNDGTENYSTLRLALEMADKRPQLAAWLLQDEMGNPARSIESGKTYTLGAVLSHGADTAQLWLDGNPIAIATQCDQLSSHFSTNEETDHLQVELLVNKDRWSCHYSKWFLAHNNMEDFESGDWNNYPWQITNLNPWQIDSTATHGGAFCARSAPIGNNQRSTMTLELETLTDDSVVFYYYVSSEGSDWLYFFVDGRRRGYWSGNSGWQRYARFLPSGKHTLQWIYQKNASGHEREDLGRIDDIRLPLAMWNQPYGHGVKDSVAVGLDLDFCLEDDFSVWPNPAGERVTIAHGIKPYDRVLIIYDAYGREVDKIKIEDNNETTQYLTHHLRFGIYTLVLHNKEGRLVRKLTVTK